MNKIIFVVVILSSLSHVFAQDSVEVISGFRGLDTRSSDLNMLPNYSRVFHNLDAGAQQGGITPRMGYDSVSTIEGMDSILNNGLFNASWLDNSKSIFIVTDSTGVGHGGIYITKNDASVEFQPDSITRIVRYWGAITQPYFAQVNNQVFISSADHRGVIYDQNKMTSHDFPLRAPGVVSTLPLNSIGAIDGTVQYAIANTRKPTAAGITPTDTVLGVIHDPVSVSLGTILLHGFTAPIADSIDHPDRPQLEIFIPATVNVDDTFTVTIDGDVATYISIANDNKDSVMKKLTAAVILASPMGSENVSAVHTGPSNMVVYSTDVPSTDGRFDWTDTAAYLTQLYDTVYSILIYRNNDPRELDIGDSLFIVQALLVKFNDSVFVPSPATLLDSFTYIDNLTNPIDAGQAVDLHLIHGRDTVGALAQRFGAPTFISSDSMDAAADTLSSNGGIYRGNVIKERIITGTSYAVTYFDTISRQESPLGGRLDITRPTTGWSQTGEEIYTIRLPKTPSNADHLVLNLYRAEITRFERDSTFSYDSVVTVDDCITYYVGGKKITECGGGGTKTVTKLGSVQIIDSSRVALFRLLQTGLSPDTTYTDSLRYDIFVQGGVNHPFFQQLAPPSNMKILFSFQGRLFFASGSRLYYSNLDLEQIGQNVSQFGSINFISINEGDGDEITTAYPAGDAIKVYKNNSGFLARQVDLPSPFIGQEFVGSQTFWITAAKTDFFGVIAPNSHLAGPEGYYFLSANGILRESPSQFLEHAFNVDTVSARLNNFDLIDRETKYRTRSQRIPDEQKYLWTIGDTTYVWDAISQTWGTWNLNIGSSIIFDSAKANEIRAGQDMYFVVSGGSSLLKYGGPTDNDTSVYIDYKSGPISTQRGFKSVSQIGMWSTSSDTATGIQVTLFDFKGDILDSIIVDSLQQRYNVISWDINDPSISKFFELRMTNDTLITDSTNLSNTVIEAIELWWRPEETPVRARTSK